MVSHAGTSVCDWSEHRSVLLMFLTAEVPQAKALLASDETIINPYYMRQLLEYGIKLGQQAQAGDIDPAHLVKEAEVGAGPFAMQWSSGFLMLSFTEARCRAKGPRIVMKLFRYSKPFSLGINLQAMYSSAQLSVSIPTFTLYAAKLLKQSTPCM